MRDVSSIRNRRTFINNTDDNLREDDNDKSYYYDSLQDKHCPGCRRALSYNAKTNHLVCSCGYIRDLNEEESNAEEDYGGATTANSNRRKDPFNADSSIPTVIPMAQRRTGIIKESEWLKDLDVRKLSDRGYQVTNYVEIVKDDKKSFNPTVESDPFFADRARSEGGSLNTKFDQPDQVRKTLKKL